MEEEISEMSFSLFTLKPYCRLFSATSPLCFFAFFWGRIASTHGHLSSSESCTESEQQLFYENLFIYAVTTCLISLI